MTDENMVLVREIGELIQRKLFQGGNPRDVLACLSGATAALAVAANMPRDAFLQSLGGAYDSADLQQKLRDGRA